MSRKLSGKLRRQLGEALSVAAGATPGWCGRLAGACPWLLDLAGRERLTKCGALGLSHALFALQVAPGLTLIGRRGLTMDCLTMV